MSFLNNDVFDLGLNELTTDGDRLDICSQEPATHTEATSTYTLGNKTTLSVGAPGAGDPNGRQVTVATFSDGSVTGTASATHYAVSDTTGTRLLAANSLASAQAVTSGNTFSLAAFTIRIPAPA